MKVILDLKKPCNFFWLRAIKKVRIDTCCAKCFIGDKYNEVFEQTRYKDRAHIELDIKPNEEVKAYYLCGLSHRWIYSENTHIAFVPCDGQSITIDNDKIHLCISDARQIDFQRYTPSPKGIFSQEQRQCRNWIFANYIMDGMPL